MGSAVDTTTLLRKTEKVYIPQSTQLEIRRISVLCVRYTWLYVHVHILMFSIVLLPPHLPVL